MKNFFHLKHGYVLVFGITRLSGKLSFTFSVMVAHGRIFLKNYSPKFTVYDRFRRWCEEGIFEQIRNTILEILVEDGMDIRTAYINATVIKGCLECDKMENRK